MASIYFEKGRNKYRAAFITPLGKRITKRFDTKQDAQDWIDLNRLQVKSGDFIEPKKILLGEWIVTYLKTYKKDVRKSTFKSYLTIARKLAPISNFNLQEAETLEYQKFFNSLDISPRTEFVMKSFLSSAIEKAVELGLVRKNWVKYVTTQKSSRKEVEVFTREEIEKILSASKGYNIHNIILMAVSTGMRIGEILALEWRDYNGLYIHVSRTMSAGQIGETTKTPSSLRNIILPPNVISMLNEMKAKDKFSFLIFHTRNGKPIRYAYVWTAWVNTLKRANIPYRNIHVLRHTHASQLLLNSVPITEVSRRIGHASVSTTLNVYSHSVKGRDKEMQKKVSEIFSPQNAPK